MSPLPQLKHITHCLIMHSLFGLHKCLQMSLNVSRCHCCPHGGIQLHSFSSLPCQTAPLQNIGVKVQPLLTYHQHLPLTLWSNIRKKEELLLERPLHIITPCCILLLLALSCLVLPYLAIALAINTAVTHSPFLCWHKKRLAPPSRAHKTQTRRHLPGMKGTVMVENLGMIGGKWTQICNLHREKFCTVLRECSEYLICL